MQAGQTGSDTLESIVRHRGTLRIAIIHVVPAPVIEDALAREFAEYHDSNLTSTLSFDHAVRLWISPAWAGRAGTDHVGTLGNRPGSGSGQ